VKINELQASAKKAKPAVAVAKSKVNTKTKAKPTAKPVKKSRR
jgi:hypothetical protein